MASTTRCFKKRNLIHSLFCLAIGLLLGLSEYASAQSAGEGGSLIIDRISDEIVVSTEVQFELPPSVEDALQRGVPLYFGAHADILRERWYWYDKKVASQARQLKLAYQPLTRRWRLTVSSGLSQSASQGLSLSQNFDTLPHALSALKRTSRWKIADVSELDPSTSYRVEFQFRLEVGLLPLPFQIGTLGQSDWSVAVSLGAPLTLEPVK
jgi:hypothetical protein